MAASAFPDGTASRSTSALAALRGREAGYQAFVLLRIAFTVAPIAFGLDKFFNVMVDWPIYLAPWINDIAPGSGQDFMYLVGGVEILAGVLVAVSGAVSGITVVIANAWMNTPTGFDLVNGVVTNVDPIEQTMPVQFAHADAEQLFGSRRHE